MYLEVFPYVDSTSSEKKLSGTYSYWIYMGDVDNEPGTSLPEYDTVLFNVLSNTKNTNSNTPITFADYDGTVFVATGSFSCVPNGEDEWKELVSSSGEKRSGVALARRGFYWTLSSRFLAESDVLALSENRVRVGNPSPSSSDPASKFDSGYYFVDDQYDASPAISDTRTRDDGETFEWVVYPKIAANIPDRIIDEDEVLWFDFSAHFPASVRVNFSGTAKIRFKAGNSDYDASPDFQIVNCPIDCYAIYEKQIVEINQTSVVKYAKTFQSRELDDGSGNYAAGPTVDATVSWSFNGESLYDTVFQFTVRAFAPEVIFAHQNNYSGGIDVFQFSQFEGIEDREYVYQRGGARLNKNFTQNEDACYLFCGSCDGTGGSFPPWDQTPFNFGGVSQKNKNANAWLARFPRDPFRQNIPLNPPYEIEDDNSTGGEIEMNGIGTPPYVSGWGPLIVWGDEAGSGSVTFETYSNNFAGAPDTYDPDFPDLRCSSDGVVNFYVAERNFGSPPGEDNSPYPLSVGIGAVNLGIPMVWYISSIT